MIVKCERCGGKFESDAKNRAKIRCDHCDKRGTLVYVATGQALTYDAILMVG
jgi:Zn finger protein HypA/HybF involved in hydrogenase expression